MCVKSKKLSTNLNEKLDYIKKIPPSGGLSFTTSIPPSLINISYGAASLETGKEKNNPVNPV